ncbi:MAG: DUF2298 domain-containing protein, partial [Phototrophicaceae bacterium]
MPKARVIQSNVLVAVLLSVILLIGGAFRFVGLNWDDFTHLHPDERFLTQVLSSLGGDINLTEHPDAAERYAICQSRYPDDNGRGTYLNGGYFDANCSSLNPNNLGYGLYVYGTLPLFIADIASDRFVDLSYIWANWQAERNGTPPPNTWDFDYWSGYSGAHLIWRGLNGFSDLITVFLVFLIARRLHGNWAGLIAAALYAAAPLAIQKSHFATVNAMATTFATLTLYFAVRIYDTGKWSDYALFGLAFGAALASRINLVPLVILAILATAVRMWPAINGQIIGTGARQRAMREFGGLVLAGVITVIAFRMFQPYSFEGPGILSIHLNKLNTHSFGLFNEGWLDDMGQAQFLVSGEAESPPNWQWVNRTGYVFPLSNMILWGMGVGFGLTAWLGLLWATIQLVRARERSGRNLLLIAWLWVYFAWIGNLWVMSMRYYLPLYPALAVIAAWTLLEVVNRSRGTETGMIDHVPTRRWLRVGAWALLIGVVGFTGVWGYMFTNIYRHQLTRVQASHWVWENIPGDFAMRVEGAPDGTPIISVPIYNSPATVEGDIASGASTLNAGNVFENVFVAPADGLIRSVEIPHLGATDSDSAPESLLVQILPASGIGLLSQGTLSANMTRDNHPIGDGYTLVLDVPVEVLEGATYTFTAEVTTEDTLRIAGAIVSNEGAWDDPLPYVVCTLPNGITVADDPPPGLNTARDCNGRNAYTNLINGYEMAMSLDDIEIKRERMRLTLDNSDYIIISSNRFYDTISRNQGRWPMTLAYYQALFGGELGYDLVETFQETFEIGGIVISDQHLPTHTAPAWLNEFEAEEAFHVYDHPVVFVFKKRADYTPDLAALVLDSVSLLRADDVMVGAYTDPTLIGVNPIYSLPADEIPTQLALKPDLRDLQYQGGTWSERFFRTSVINTQPVLAVGAWWLLIVGFGIITFPLCFAMFPALADRGYGVSKLVGLLIVGWVTWLLTYLHLYIWNIAGLWAVFGGLAAFSGWVGWRRRAELLPYVREHWRRLLAIELVTLLAFLFFLGVRLTNPDLWHQSFGGEKPMDFAYFNAVLRSTAFPPYDPWNAGGYINYYYFGFVLIGSPVLMLGMIPSIAYNLALPMLFALTGIGAFSVAFNLVACANDAALNQGRTLLRQLGSPWIAGIMALLLAVMLGNLNTPRVFFDGVARLGGYTAS